jgi:hypothetical protein
MEPGFILLLSCEEQRGAGQKREQNGNSAAVIESFAAMDGRGVALNRGVCDGTAVVETDFDIAGI